MLSSLYQRFAHAGRGLRYALTREFSFRVELIFLAAVLILAGWLRVSLLTWLVIVLSAGLVLAAELFNTAVERLADLLESRLSPQVKTIKDLLSGAVVVGLLAAGIAIGLGFALTEHSP